MAMTKREWEELIADGLCSVPEAVEITGLSRAQIYHLMETNQLTYVRLGQRSRRIPRTALSEWMRSGLVPASA
jgi:excisionase family DNA binding protein